MCKQVYDSQTLLRQRYKQETYLEDEPQLKVHDLRLLRGQDSLNASSPDAAG